MSIRRCFRLSKMATFCVDYSMSRSGCSPPEWVFSSCERLAYQDEGRTGL